MRNPTPMSTWLHFPIYGRRTYGNCTCQFITGHRTARHILRSSPLPLRFIHGCSICYYGCFRTLIPTLYRVHPTRHMNKNPFRSNVRRGQSDILPSTLPRASGYATAILGLPRRLYPLKYRFFYWVPGVFSGGNYVPIYFMRSLRR